MSASEAEDRDVRIAIALRATSQSLGWIGTQAGIFHRLGLHVTFPAMDVALEAVAGLIRVEWDFAEIGGAPIVQGGLEGHDTVMLVAAERAPVAGVYLVARRGLTEPAHLRGGRLGVLSETGQLAISARAMLRESGVTATLVPLGTLAKIYAALRAQDIDAGMLTEEYRLAAQREFGLTAFPIPATGLPPALATTRRLIGRRRGLVARVVPLLHRFLQQFNEATVEDIYAFYAPRFQPLPLPSAVVIQQMLNDFAAIYPAAQALPPTAVTDTSMLEELEQSGFIARLYGR